MIELHRRGLITGLISLVAAPAIVRASSLMPVKALPMVLVPTYKVGDWVEITSPGSLPSGLETVGWYQITHVDQKSLSLGGMLVYLK